MIFLDTLKVLFSPNHFKMVKNDKNWNFLAVYDVEDITSLYLEFNSKFRILIILQLLPAYTKLFYKIYNIIEKDRLLNDIAVESFNLIQNYKTLFNGKVGYVSIDRYDFLKVYNQKFKIIEIEVCTYPENMYLKQNNDVITNKCIVDLLNGTFTVNGQLFYKATNQNFIKLDEAVGCYYQNVFKIS